MPKKTKRQKDAAKFIELYGIVHFLLTEQRCPVLMPDGRLAYCAWCPTKREAELEAARMGARVTHDICPTCSAKLIAQVTGDKT